MKKRLATIVVAAAGGAALIGGVSSAVGVNHGAQCAALHAKSAYWQNQANHTTDPTLKARYQNRANTLMVQADKCDARGTTTSSSSTSTSGP